MKAINPFRLMATLIAAVMMTHTANRVVAATTNDLRAEWSDSQNPNGVWSYNQGTTPLPHADCLLSSCKEFNCCVPAWQISGCGAAWCKVPPCDITNIAYYRFQAGDVVMHSAGGGNVTWTARFDGLVSISGGIWAAAYLGRANHWELYHNQNRLTWGDISDADTNYSRTMPFDFQTGSGGAAVLQNRSVSVGDTIKLEITHTTSFATMAGVNLTVVTVPCPPASIRLSEVEVCWPSISNGFYRVEFRSDLTTNMWQPFLTNVVGTGETMCVYDRVARGQPQRFYRVVCQTE